MQISHGMTLGNFRNNSVNYSGFSRQQVADPGFERIEGSRPLEVWGTELKRTQGKCVSSFASGLKEVGTLLPIKSCVEEVFFKLEAPLEGFLALVLKYKDLVFIRSTTRWQPRATFQALRKI